MKNLFLNILSFLSKKIINKHKPFVIGITGTVGKTTVTNFVYEFLSTIYPNDVYKSEFDYNGEFGLPLTILQLKTPGKNPLLWIGVFIQFTRLYLSKKFPKFLILEYGIDRIGEMEFLTNIVKPNIAIILNISPNHVTQFPDYKDYINEKTLLGKVAENVIYNADDAILYETFGKNKNSISYGISGKGLEITGGNILSNIGGISFDIVEKGISTNVQFNIIGDHQVYNILPVFALGKILNIDFNEVKEILSNIQPQKGRGTVLKGINDSIIIDGSYNGGFTSLSSGINYLQNLEEDINKILFAGEMRELGSESKKLHTEIANIIISKKIDKIILVGDEMQKYVLETTKEAFGEENVFRFKLSIHAGEKIRELLKESNKKSVIYTKGSQNTIFLEEGIKKFLYDLQDTKKLCRQSEKWLRTKEDFFGNN